MTEDQELEQLATEIAALEELAKATVETERESIPEPAPVAQAPKPKRTKKKESKPVVEEKPVIETKTEVKVNNPRPEVLFGAARIKAKILKHR